MAERIHPSPALLSLAQRLSPLLDCPPAFSLDLGPLCTYRVGGPADLAVRPSTCEELARVLQALDEDPVPFAVLGGGSNLLVADRGFRGVVVLTAGLGDLRVEGTCLHAGAGVASHAVAEAALAAGLTGAEFLTGLPGSIGGACFMNARAYGGEVSQVLRRARVIHRDGQQDERSLGPEQFAYKRSPFQDEGLVLGQATLILEEGDIDQIRQRMEIILRSRRDRHEPDHPSCGCVFKNDYRIGISSGQLIESLGLKGFRIGDAQVSPYHANFIINLGRATATDIRRVMDHVRRTVASKTGFELELEVQLLGEWA